MKKTENPIFKQPAVTLVTDKDHYAYVLEANYTKKEAVDAFGNNLNKIKTISKKNITETFLKKLWKKPSATVEKFKVLALLTFCDPIHYTTYYNNNLTIKDMFDMYVINGGFFKSAADTAEFFNKVDRAIELIIFN